MRDPLTPADVRRLLDSYGLSARKAAGQNFVIDPNTVRKIVRDAGIGDVDTVLEIGPGLGSLTIPLAAAAKQVVAVEIDAGMVRALGEVLESFDNVEIVHADALHSDLAALVGGGPATLVSNLPYNVATPLVMRGLEAGPVFGDLFVMVQKEVGQRWTADPGHPLYGAVSVKIALVADAEVVAEVPRAVFYPVPNVDSVTVRLTRRPDAPVGADYARLAAVVDAAFAQRRKTVRNNLGRLVGREEAATACGSAGVDPSARAETLDVEAFRRLAAALDARI